MEQKRLTLSEYDAIVAFDRLCFPQDHWTEEDWRELLADESIKEAYLGKKKH